MEIYEQMNKFDLNGPMTRMPFINGAGPVCDAPDLFSLRHPAAISRFFRTKTIPHK